MSKPPFHIPSLDGIRAVAFLTVFLSHAGLERMVPGGLGVTIFFFLSGYLITTLLRRELERSGRIDLKQFYIRRMLRIWPSFYFVLALGVLLTLAGLLPGEIRAVPMLSQVLHFANYYSIFHGNDGMVIGSGVFWSLAVEEHFYLVFPCLYLALVRLGLRPRGQVLVLGVLCAAVLAWRYGLCVGMGADAHRTFSATDTRLDSILFGCMLAIWGNPVLDARHGSERLWKFGLVPAGLVLLGATLGYRSADFRETARYTLQGLALYPLFVAAIRYPGWPPFRVLNSKPLRLLGLLSYPLYLVHFTVIAALEHTPRPLPPLIRGIVAFGISLALAYAIYHLIERPMTRLRKKHHAARPSPLQLAPDLVLAPPPFRARQDGAIDDPGR